MPLVGNLPIIQMDLTLNVEGKILIEKILYNCAIIIYSVNWSNKLKVVLR